MTKVKIKKKTTVSKKKVCKTQDVIMSGDKAFFCNNGEVYTSVSELANALKKISTKDFKHHCTKDNCDFANWIEHCIGDKSLAKKVCKATSKKETQEVLKKYCK